MTRLLPLLTALAMMTALAAPPPNHPTPAQAMDILKHEQPKAPGDLPNQGKVISTIGANEFTYIEVERNGAIEWIAAPLMAINPGSTIRYEEGSVMTNFYSKLLKRTFPTVTFVGHVIITAP